MQRNLNLRLFHYQRYSIYISDVTVLYVRFLLLLY